MQSSIVEQSDSERVERGVHRALLLLRSTLSILDRSILARSYRPLAGILAAIVQNQGRLSNHRFFFFLHVHGATFRMAG